ncbi:pancreatic lipase-related protein 2-like isoform X2 [Dermacentor albipictus]|uniref:pancreatic lipase-related protein 2-like isoform X2 n=1 Tax=Dermacentor albipictus TaxID=60249 RepID=UPI0031FD860D
MPGCFCRLVRNNEAGSLYTLQLIEVNVAVTRVSACKRVQCGTFAWDVPSRILNKCKIMLTTMTFILLFLHYKSYASTMGQAGTPNEKEMPAKAKSKDAEGGRATKEEICYANVGCFSRHDRLTHPFNFPSNPNLFMPFFHLYSRKKRHIPTVFQLKPKGNYRYLVEFGKEKPLFILIHGWLESAYAPWAQSIKDALLREEDSNVLVVDWSGLAATTYANAAANTAAVGRTLALVVQRLVEEFPLRAALVHAIGYSFGAQVAGFFGRNIKKNTGTLVARITALDPAGPLFNDTNVCVCPEDAAFVDVIHTSGGYKHQPWQLGLLRPTGHVDFYVNGAKDQPGCCGCESPAKCYRGMETLSTSLEQVYSGSVRPRPGPYPVPRVTGEQGLSHGVAAMQRRLCSFSAREVRSHRRWR